MLPSTLRGLRRLSAREASFGGRAGPLRSISLGTSSGDAEQAESTALAPATHGALAAKPKRGVISSLATNIGRLTHRSSLVDPEFEILSNGLGSMIYASVPPQSYFYAKPGTLIASSMEVSTAVTMDGNPGRALMRKIAGGSFFLESVSTGVAAGDAMISPPGLGDVALLPMDGTTRYKVKPGCFLAGTPHLTVSSRMNSMTDHLGETGLFSILVSGRGQLAVTSYGGLFRLVLEEGDEYYASTRHLVAWDAQMNPVPVGADAKGGFAPVVFAKRLWANLRGRITGEQEMCCLHGPGDFFLASRVEPRFNALRQSAQASVNEYMTVKTTSEIGKAVKVQEDQHRAANMSPADVQRAKAAQVAAAEVKAKQEQAVAAPVRETVAANGTAAAGARAKAAAQPSNAKPGAEKAQKAWYQFWK